MSLALIVCLCLTSVPAAAASEAKFTAEEVIYARLDANGTPKEGYAVVALNVTGAGTVTPYGDYSQIVNLSNTTPVEYSDGKVTMEARPGAGTMRVLFQRLSCPGTLRLATSSTARKFHPTSWAASPASWK